MGGLLYKGEMVKVPTPAEVTLFRIKYSVLQNHVANLIGKCKEKDAGGGCGAGQGVGGGAERQQAQVVNIAMQYQLN